MGRKQPNTFPLLAGCFQARGELPMHLEFMEMQERGGFSGCNASFPETRTQHRPEPKPPQYALKRALLCSQTLSLLVFTEETQIFSETRHSYFNHKSWHEAAGWVQFTRAVLLHRWVCKAQLVLKDSVRVWLLCQVVNSLVTPKNSFHILGKLWQVHGQHNLSPAGKPSGTTAEVFGLREDILFCSSSQNSLSQWDWAAEVPMWC